MPQWWSDGKFGKKEAGLRAQSRTLYSTSEHTITWWSDGKLVKKEAGFRAQSRTLYFTSEHSTTWWSDGKLWGSLELRAEPFISLVNTVPTWWSDGKLWGGLELRAEPTLYFTSEHSTTWWSRWKVLWGKKRWLRAQSRNPLFHQSTQHHLVVRWKDYEEA